MCMNFSLSLLSRRTLDINIVQSERHSFYNFVLSHLHVLGTKKMEYKTRQWHEKCFCCVVCKNPIGTKSFIPREQEIYCAGCYEDKFATRCVKCNKVGHSSVSMITSYVVLRSFNACRAKSSSSVTSESKMGFRCKTINLNPINSLV